MSSVEYITLNRWRTNVVICVLIKKPFYLVGDWERKPGDQLIKNFLTVTGDGGKKSIKDIKKNQQIKIDEKPSNLVKIEKENNLQTRKVGDYVFAFWFQMMMACQPCFYLIVLASGATKNRAIGREVSVRGEMAICLLGLFLWKVWISFCKCYTADTSF